MSKSLLEQMEEEQQEENKNVAIRAEQRQQLKETIETQIAIEKELKKQEEKTQASYDNLFNLFSQVNKNIISLNDNINRYNEVLKSNLDKYNTLIKDTANTTNTTLKSTIEQGFQSISSHLKETTEKIDNDIFMSVNECEKNYLETTSNFIKTIENEKEKTKNISTRFFNKSLVAIILSVIMIFLILFYCLNWTFNFINFQLPQNEILLSILKWVVAMVSGIALFCILRGFLGGKRD